jgi:hypothetical protein
VSVFNGQTDQTSDKQIKPDDNESYVSRLVKTKGDNWNDPEVIAKGKVEADEFIVNLQSQIEEMRKELERQDYASELLTKLQTKAPTPANDGKSEVLGGSNEGKTNPTADDLASLIEQVVTARESKLTKAQRLNEVNAKLEETFGTEAEAKVKTRAQELGMTMTRLQEIAADSPTAFFALMGEAPKPESNRIPQGTLNPQSNFNRSSERTFAWYEELKKQDRKAYWSAKVQKEMFADAKRLGDKFYQ